MKKLIPALALALAGCGPAPLSPERQAIEDQRGVLRMKLNHYCLANLPAGPVQTRYNDWDEVVSECSSQAYYQANHCSDPALCLAALATPDMEKVK